MTSRMNKYNASLLELADEQYKCFHSKICPDIPADRIIGVQIPKIRYLAARMPKEDVFDYLENADLYYYEEKILFGLLVSRLKNDALRDKYLVKFMKICDCWAVCDICAGAFKFIGKDREKYLQFISHYAQSKKEFEVRFYAVVLMSYYLTDEYIEQTIKRLLEISHDGYYVKTAVAWAFSTAYIKYPEITEKVFASMRLDPQVQNKAIQKIRDSRRVSRADKDYLLKYKI